MHYAFPPAVAADILAAERAAEELAEIIALLESNPWRPARP